MEKRYTLFFDEIDQKSLSLVGGKGANLGEMTKAGFPVPYGFCVTTESYQEFLSLNHLQSFISETIKDVSLDTISQVGETLRRRLEDSEIPRQVKNAIMQALKDTDSDTYYAVRSSATAEDLAFASFAGQQDTYLNVKGEANLLEAIQNCWASLFTDRAILYRIQNNIAHEKVLMSVVVQKMVLPEASGILFTADPVSGHRGFISIDAGYGLGEALVSGLVSPDIYKYNKKSRKIESKTIAEKKLAILALAVGGTQKIMLSEEKATSQVLDDSLIRSLAELGMKIEKHYGCPQDIEWCLSREHSTSGENAPTLSIVQSRAITSLFPLPTPLPQDDALHAYFSFNHIQVMTEPISPLGIDMLRIIASFDTKARGPEDYRVMTSAGGRIYLDVSEIIAHKTIGKSLSRFLVNAEALMAASLKELMNRPDFATTIKKNENTVKSLRRFIKPIAIKALKNLTYKNPEGTVDFVSAYIDERVRRVQEEINKAKPGVEKLEAIYHAACFTPDFQVLLPKMAPAMLSFKALEGLEKKLLGESKYTQLIVTGLEGNITTEMGLLVGDLADLVRESKELIRELENENYATLFTRLDNLPGHGDFKKAFHSFMTKYDMRAAGEIDMAKDRWIENPEPLVRSILSTVKTALAGAHRLEYKATITRAKQASEELVKEVEAKHGKLKAKVIRRLIRVLRNYLPIREHPKYLIMKLVLIFKKAFLEEAQALVAKGHLVTEKDIFYVSFWELHQAIKENSSLLELVEKRKEEYRHFWKLRAPRLLTSDGEEVKGGYHRADLPEGALVGMPVSTGVIEGVARVITDPTTVGLNKGEILVAPFTDPGWTPLFINAAGLVMEVGGLLTHGTVVAREYGIPAVVGITDATKLIKTGQKIRVDGNAGFVLVLEE